MENSTETTVDNNSSLRILLPLLLLVVIAMGAWYLFSGGNHKAEAAAAEGADTLKTKTEQVVTDVKTTATAAPGKLDSLSGDWIYDAGEMATITLPGNAGTLTVGKNSTEYKLVNFLNDKNTPVDTVKGNWFEFTNVHFKKGGAELTEESMVQLKNIVTIAKAYPAARLSLVAIPIIPAVMRLMYPCHKKGLTLLLLR